MRPNDPPDPTDLRPALIASIELVKAKRPAAVEYEDPSDEIAQSLSVIYLEANPANPTPDLAAIMAAARRIADVCSRGLRWRDR